MISNLRPSIIIAACVFFAGCNNAQEPEAEPFLAQYEQIDLLIENGSVFDGYGDAPVRENVVVVGEQIVFVGETSFSEHDLANRVKNRIDAYDKAVTPGFIDLHSHGDPLATPRLENFLAMGVTTITLGQDGDSPDVVPLSD